MGPRISVVVAVSVAVLVASGGVASGRNSHKSRTTRLAVRIDTQKLTMVVVGDKQKVAEQVSTYQGAGGS